ncbi:Phosphomevalonate kinase [Trichuris trichiura]|uniref:Phosphomevalonate kinase n=1 Tax=Trichuris trichiura TaxID=36087 RepID=A0A077ZF44_TRITR|nr:Phosphomevalonate kinase [Trichuris trichiura]
MLLLAGKRKSGKDFVATLLEQALARNSQEIISIIPIHISNPLKREFAQLHGLTYEKLLTTSQYKELYREAMVAWGEEVRKRDSAYFCRLAIQEAVSLRNEDADITVWIICDCRRHSDITFFENSFDSKSLVMRLRVEAVETVRRQRGWIFVPGIDDRETECDLDDELKWNCILHNNDSSIYNQIDILCRHILASTTSRRHNPAVPFTFQLLFHG